MFLKKFFLSKIYFLLLIIFSFSPIFSKDVFYFEDSWKEINITSKGRLLEDISGKVRLSDILLNYDQYEFKPVQKDIFNTGFNDSNIWFYYEFYGNFSKKEALIELISHQIDELEFHYVVESESIDCTRAEQINSQSCVFANFFYTRNSSSNWNNPIHSKNLIFPIPITPGKSKVKALFRLKSNGSSIFSVNLVDTIYF